MRDIAAAAGLSTGAVFASFTDKADLFGAVIIDDYEALAAHLRAADHDRSTTEARCSSCSRRSTPSSATICRWCGRRSAIPGLGTPRPSARARRASGGSWRWSSEVLRAGVDRGELSRDLDVRLVIEMIWESFLANYRHAIFETLGRRGAGGPAGRPDPHPVGGLGWRPRR